MSIRVAFIGMPGSGKSTVARIVAYSLGVALWDSDAIIEEITQMNIPEIFKKEGETGFRTHEYEAVRSCLDREEAGVLSLGGGAPIWPATHDLLTSLPLVYIRVERNELVRRLSQSHNPRPLLQGDMEGKLSQLEHDRAAIYENTATYVVDSDSSPALGVAQRVLDILGYPEIRAQDPRDVAHT